MLEGLIYVSAPKPTLTDEDVKDILASARNNNNLSDVTGILLYSPRMFVQVLEGSTESLDKTLETIKADDRHSDVTVLTRDMQEKRVFSDWSMAFREIDEHSSSKLESEIGWDAARRQLSEVSNQHSMALLITSISHIIGH